MPQHRYNHQLIFPKTQDLERSSQLLQLTVPNAIWQQILAYVQQVRIQTRCLGWLSDMLSPSYYYNSTRPIAAHFGQPLIVKCLFHCQAWLHQHQSKSKLTHVNWYVMSQQSAMIHFNDDSFQLIVDLFLTPNCEGAHADVVPATVIPTNRYVPIGRKQSLKNDPPQMHKTP